MKASRHVVTLMDLDTMELLQAETQIVLKDRTPELITALLKGFAYYWIEDIDDCEMTFPVDVEEASGWPVCSVQKPCGKLLMVSINLDEEA